MRLFPHPTNPGLSCIYSQFAILQHITRAFICGVPCAAAGRLKLLALSQDRDTGSRSDSETEMDGGDGSPVMTDSERRAYRYGHGRASPRQRGMMRHSWSNDSLAAAGYGGGRASCVCAPTTHPGSFRCKHHRHAAHASKVADDEAPAAGSDDAKHNEKEGPETAPAADQAGKSSS